MALSILGTAAADAGWGVTEGSGTGPALFAQPQQSPAQACSSTFVPRWVPVTHAEQPEKKTDPSRVEQALAVSLSGEQSLPIGDPRLPEPMPELTPKPDPEPTLELIPESTPPPKLKSDGEPKPILKSKPKSVASPAPSLERIEPGQEMPATTDIIPLDEYDGYAPDLSFGEPPVGDTFSAGGCHRPGGRRVPGNPCYDPTLGRLWVRSDTLLWWIQGFHVPALVTTSTDPAPIPFTDGALGEPDTSVLFGDGRIGSSLYTGARIEFGYWFDPCQTVGVEAAFFGLGRENTTFEDLSDGSSVLARPFYDVRATALSAWPIAMADFSQGSVLVDASTEMLGTEVLFRRMLTRACDTRVDLLMGYRFARLYDTLHISQSSTALEESNLFAAGSTLDLSDDFSTRNLFHGAEIGIASYTRRCRWTFDTGLKLAFGSTHSSVDISGSSTAAIAGGATTTSATGLLAQATNIGRYGRQDFTMVPELGVNIGYDLTSNLRFRFGYTMLYWSKVARPGDQIDTNLDLARAEAGGLPAIPPATAEGACLPQFEMRTTDLWAQGMNLGLSYRF